MQVVCNYVDEIDTGGGGGGNEIDNQWRGTGKDRQVEEEVEEVEIKK